MNNKEMSIETMLSHYAEDRKNYYGAVVSPIYQTSLFTFDSMKAISEAFNNEQDSYIYTRGNNPTAKIAEDKIAFMENGECAKLFASGMGAISSAILSCVKTGDHIVAVETIYGPTISLLTDYLSKKFNIETTFVKADEEEIIKATKETTKLIYLESPTSLVFEIIDIKKVTDFAKSKSIKTIIDNSWATPIYQKPIDLGVDIVVHSASKYLSGHSDLVAGVIISTRQTIKNILRDEHALFGAKIAPLEAWLILRGLRTLPVRLRQHSESAMKIAEYLNNHKKVKKVNYPGLASHPRHALACKQLSGFSGLLSFELDASLEASHLFVDSLNYFNIGVSWGGFESLALNLARDGKDPSIPAGLIRVSVGLESTDDLIRDLEQAFSKIQ
jgi:cystathionine beta-lyase